MNHLLIAVFLLCSCSISARAQEGNEVDEETSRSLRRIKTSRANAERARTALNDAQTPPPPQERARLEKDLAENVGGIVSEGERHPESGPVNYTAGQALLSVDEPKKALPFADRAVELAPDEPNVRVLRGQTYYKLGDMGKAAEDAKKALELDPANKMALALMSLTAGRSGSPAGLPSARDAGASAQAPPGSPSGRSGGTSQAPPAAAAIAPATAPAVSSADKLRAAGLYRDALGKLKLGDHRAGLSLLDKAAALDPRNAKVRTAKAKAHLAAGEAAAALQEAELALSLGPRDAGALVSRGLAKRALGRSPVEFLPDLKAASELDAELADIYEEALAQHRKGVPVSGPGSFPGQGQAGPVVVRGPAPPIVDGDSVMAIGDWNFPLRFVGWALVGVLGLGTLVAYLLLRVWRSSLDEQ